MIYQFAYSRNRPIPDGVQQLDCRPRMSNCFSIAQARAHDKFDSVVREAVDILERSGNVAIGCQQGKHRSMAVALEVSKRTDQPVTYL